MVHQYKLNGYNIVLDTASSSVHAVDEVAYDIIEMYKSHTPEQIEKEICEKYGVSNYLRRELEKALIPASEILRNIKEQQTIVSIDYDKMENKKRLYTADHAGTAYCNVHWGKWGEE